MRLNDSIFNSVYRVAAYERLSKEDNRMDESSSIESQKMIIESYAKYENLNILKHYSDDGYTGSNFKRPEFEQLINDIEEGLINCVIVKDLSRLGRELYETGTYIEEYFLSKNVRFIAINDGYDSLIGDSMLGIRLSVNDLYLRDTSKKIRSSFDAKRKKGDYIGSFPKFGYIKDPNDSKKLALDDYAAPIVLQMFMWIDEGYGTSKVARILTEMKIPIPSIYKKESRGNKQKSYNDGNGIWRPQTVRGIVTDMMYLGHMIQGRWKKISYNSKKLIELPKSEWIIVENTHPPIVTQELFDSVQQKLERNKKYASKSKNRYLFQGLLNCKECGHSITISKKKLKTGYSYWTACNYYQKYSSYGVCTSHRLNYKLLEEDLLIFLKKIGQKILEDIDQERLINESLSYEKKELINSEKQLKRIEEDKKKKESILFNLYEDRLNGIVSTNQYSMMSKKYEKEIQLLEQRKEEVINQINDLKDNNYSDSYKKCKKALKKYMNFECPTNELMHQIIDRIEIDKENNVEVFFKTDVSRYVNLEVKKGEILTVS